VTTGAAPGLRKVCVGELQHHQISAQTCPARELIRAFKDILADTSTDPEEVAHRRLAQASILDEAGRFVASIPTKLDPRRRSSG